MNKFEKLFDDYMLKLCSENPDPSHDILHVRRVVDLSKKMAEYEQADLDVVVPAAYLHDCVYISKADGRRPMSSQISANKAEELLNFWSYDREKIMPIKHAIEAHSFSAGIEAKTLEAKIVQDADRLDAMGAIGIFRCFAFTGLAKKSFYNPDEPFARNRGLDDTNYSLDHFYVKLLKLNDMLHTATAKEEGKKRLTLMQNYLSELKRELQV